MSDSLDPDQIRPFVGSDLGPNCLNMLSADDTSSQRVQIHAKMNLKIPSAQVACCIYLFTLLTNVSIQANSVDQDRSSGSLSKRFLKHLSRCQSRQLWL